MSLSESKQAADAAADTILKNSGGDAILLIVVKDGEALIVSKSTQESLVTLTIAADKAVGKLMDKCVTTPESLLEALGVVAGGDK